MYQARRAGVSGRSRGDHVRPAPAASPYVYVNCAYCAHRAHCHTSSGEAPVSIRSGMPGVRPCSTENAPRGLIEKQAGDTDTGCMGRKIESFERINSIRETNGNIDSCNSCKRLGTIRLHELHESKFLFVSRIEFIRSKLSNFLLMYPRTFTEASPRIFEWGTNGQPTPKVP